MTFISIIKRIVKHIQSTASYFQTYKLQKKQTTFPMLPKMQRENRALGIKKGLNTNNLLPAL